MTILTKYTIHLYTKSGHSKKVEVFAKSLLNACDVAKWNNKGSSVSMAWHNYPIETREVKNLIELNRSK